MIKLPGVYYHNDVLGWCYRSLKTGNYVFLYFSDKGFDLVEMSVKPQFLALDMPTAIREIRRPGIRVEVSQEKDDIVDSLVDLFDKTVLDDDGLDSDSALVFETDDGDQCIDWSLLNRDFVHDWLTQAKSDGVFRDSDIDGLKIPFDKTPHQVLTDLVYKALKKSLAT